MIDIIKDAISIATDLVLIYGISVGLKILKQQGLW